MIVHTCVPLLIFYHYHSSACLAYVWSRAYRKETVVNAQSTANRNDNNSSVNEIPAIHITQSSGNMYSSQTDIVSFAEVNQNNGNVTTTQGVGQLRTQPSPRALRVMELQREDRLLRSFPRLSSNPA